MIVPLDEPRVNQKNTHTNTPEIGSGEFGIAQNIVSGSTGCRPGRLDSTLVS